MRPGHFRAVVDVLDRFIKIIKPRNIYLGEKDMQQLRIVKNFLINKKIKTKVISCKTIRENTIKTRCKNTICNLVQQTLCNDQLLSCCSNDTHNY